MVGSLRDRLRDGSRIVKPYPEVPLISWGWPREESRAILAWTPSTRTLVEAMNVNRTLGGPGGGVPKLHP
jgi:hypothetical protein